MQIELILKSIQSITMLTEDEWKILNACLEERVLNKNEYLLKAGEICEFVAFVTRGTLIYSKLQEDGTETTTDFAFAGDWVTDNRSRLKSSPSLIYIKAIEKSALQIISNQKLSKCYQAIPKLEKVGRVLMEQAYIKISQQSIDLQTLSAAERYEKMLQEYPEIFQKVSLYHIANYLGIAPKSLSRIRKS